MYVQLLTEIDTDGSIVVFFRHLVLDSFSTPWDLFVACVMGVGKVALVAVDERQLQKKTQRAEKREKKCQLFADGIENLGGFLRD